MKTLLASALVLALTACSTLTDPFVLRVIEYGAQAGVLTSGQVGGCTMQVAESPASAAGKGSTAFVFVYQGERCSAQVQGK